MPKIEYNGIEFDSEEERIFHLYLEELKTEGWVKDYTFHTKSFTLSEQVKYTWVKEMKSKKNEMEITLLQPHIYTPDFHVFWNKKALGIFYLNIHDGKNKLDSVPFINNIGNDGYDVGSFIEIKPSFDFQNMTRLAIINIKWVYCEYKILVQKITPVAKTKCLLDVKWDEEFKMGEHEDYFWRMKQTKWQVFSTEYIKAKYINYKPNDYDKMRRRTYNEYRTLLQKKYGIKGWVKYERG